MIQGIEKQDPEEFVVSRCVKDCPLKSIETEVVVPWDIHGAFCGLLEEFEGCEWEAYLYGESYVINKDEVGGEALKDEPNLQSVQIRVTDYYIPKQIANSGFVKPEPDEEASRRGVPIGKIHSHHKMGGGHSGTDDDSVNYVLSIIITGSSYKDAKYHPKRRVFPACAGEDYKLLDTKIEVFVEAPIIDSGNITREDTRSVIVGGSGRSPIQDNIQFTSAGAMTPDLELFNNETAWCVRKQRFENIDVLATGDDCKSCKMSCFYRAGYLNRTP